MERILNYDKINYFDVLKKQGYQKIEDIRTFDGKTLYVKFHGKKEEETIILH
jgi:hypothetical protein